MRDRGEPVDRRAEPARLAAGDVAHHLGGARRGGAARRRASRCCSRCSRLLEISLFPYAVILQVTPIVAIAPLIIIWVQRAVSGAAGLRLDRRVLPDRRRTPRSGSTAPTATCSRCSGSTAPRRADAALSAPADRAALFPRRAADQRRAGADRRGRRRVRRRHRRRRDRARLPHPRSRLSPGDPAHVRGAVPAVGDRHRDLSGARSAVAPGCCATGTKARSRTRRSSGAMLTDGSHPLANRTTSALISIYRNAWESSVSIGPLADELALDAHIMEGFRSVYLSDVRSVQRNEAIARLRGHEAELRNSASSTSTCLGQRRAARPKRIPTSICSSITSGAGSVCTS